MKLAEAGSVQENAEKAEWCPGVIKDQRVSSIYEELCGLV